jgi:hypothetical protein
VLGETPKGTLAMSSRRVLYILRKHWDWMFAPVSYPALVMEEVEVSSAQTGASLGFDFSCVLRALKDLERHHD